MYHYESRIKVNEEWRTLLVVKSDTQQEFTDSISFEIGEKTIIYYTNGVYRQFEEDGKYTYWFLPSYKETIITQDAEARETIILLEQQLTDTQMALCETYEQNIVLEQQLTDTQLALCDVYELVLGGEW